jgi:hypothetical protein
MENCYTALYSKAKLDPYETACWLVELIQNMKQDEQPLFIDNKGNEFPW